MNWNIPSNRPIGCRRRFIVRTADLSAKTDPTSNLDHLLLDYCITLPATPIPVTSYSRWYLESRWPLVRFPVLNDHRAAQIIAPSGTIKRENLFANLSHPTPSLQENSHALSHAYPQPPTPLPLTAHLPGHP